MRMDTRRLNTLSVVSVLLAGMLVAASVAMAVEVGDKAPDFTLPSTTGEKISLSQFQGKNLVLLEFFIAAASQTGT